VIAAIVLAAGAGKRFGAQKLVAPLRGHPLVRWAVMGAIAAGVDDVVVVVGHDAASVTAAVDGLPVRVVRNEHAAAGMSTSLAAGVRTLRPGTRAAFVVLGDQPSVPAEVFHSLRARYEKERGKGEGKGSVRVVVPRYAGERGNPVLFDAAVFPELLLVEGDRGAREVVTRDEKRLADVDFAFAMPADVDDRAALDAAERAP